MLGLGPTELFIILLIVVILFGAGRIARLGGELGGAVSNFRREVNSGDNAAKDDSQA